MRRHYFLWSIAVFGIFTTIYGAYLLAYNFSHGKELSIPSLILLISGVIALTVFLFLFIPRYLAQKKKKDEPVAHHEEYDVIEEEIEETPQEEIKPSMEPKVIPRRDEYVPRSERRSQVSFSYVTSTIYVKQVGYGSILRVEGSRILDMRTNTYYRIENGLVKQEGNGPVFEIRGNQIKNAFGGYLYEISGSNINKVYGGFYASISGNYITIHDLSMKYEMSEPLSRNQLLAVAALLFGNY